MIALPSEVEKAISNIENSGYEAFVVGGCVRDNLMGNAPKDYDITTSALPEQTEQIFAGYTVIKTGIKHGTVTVVIDKVPLEITTYRVENSYSDNRHPDSVSFTRSLREDAARRDFTINSIAYSHRTGICDYFGGRADIENKIIRCVGNPDKRFKEDALRILRALRFSSVLGFEIEQDTKQAVFDNKELLRNISSERIAAELFKLLGGKNVRGVLMEYIDVLGAVIPELLPMKGFEQHNFHHIYDVLEHTAAAVEAVQNETPLRLAALFHDVGKPLCFTIADDGVGHFYGHSKISAEIADSVLKRLKIDNATRELVITLIKQHDVQFEEKESAVKRALNRLTPEVFFKLIQLKRADTLALSPEYAYRMEHFDELERIAKDIILQSSCFSLKDLAINGNDLINLGIPKGRQIGIALSTALEKVISGELENNKSALIEYLTKLF